MTRFRLCLFGATVLLVLAAARLCAVAGTAVHSDRSDNRGDRINDNDDSDDRSGRSNRLTWWQEALVVKFLPRTTASPVTLAAKLEAFDLEIGAGVARCAPEIFNIKRDWMSQLQPDWVGLKPNMQPAWEAWVAVPGVVFDDEAAADCARLFRDGDCAELRWRYDDCTAPFRGSLAAAEPCFTDAQCASDTCLDRACTGPDDCEDDADCPADMRCRRVASSFASCVDADDASGAVAASAAALEMAAADFGDEGIDHGIDDGIDPGIDDGIVDNQDDNEDDVVVAPEEEGCDCDAERDGKVCIDGRCVDVVVVDLGAVCDERHLCRGQLKTAVCLDGRCAPALSATDACEDHNQCKDDLRCLDHQCEGPRAAGDPCEDDASCAEGLGCYRDDVGDRFCGLGLGRTSEVFGRSGR